MILGIAIGASCSADDAATLDLEVQSADPIVIRSTDALLSSRFEALCADGRTCVSSTVSGSTIKYLLEGPIDSAALIFAYSQAGKFEISLVDGEAGYLVASNKDVESVVVQDDAVLIRLKSDAHESMLSVTTENVGKKMRITLDEIVLSEAMIRGQIGGEFLLSLPPTLKPNSVAGAIRFGPLQAEVQNRN